MKIFNLAAEDLSDIKYTISKMPDGQQQVDIVEGQYFSQFNAALGIEKNDSVQIKSRLNNWLDLELIVCAVASLREKGVKEIHLFTPYFLGARSDRKFKDGGNNYLKDVICPIVNSLNFESVTVMDAHSDVLEACLKNFRNVGNAQVVKWAITDMCSGDLELTYKKTVFVSPDAGASKKIYKVAEALGYEGEIITCSKSRDNEGKLTNTVVPIGVHDLKKSIIIIDDICDGGRTFINIAKKIIETRPFSSIPGPDGKLYLIVTHGIFSSGFRELAKYFDGIYCTNSYIDKDNMDLGFGETNTNNWFTEKFKQVNIF